MCFFIKKKVKERKVRKLLHQRESERKKEGKKENYYYMI